MFDAIQEQYVSDINVAKFIFPDYTTDKNIACPILEAYISKFNTDADPLNPSVVIPPDGGEGLTYVFTRPSDNVPEEI